MKRFLAMIIASAMMVSLVACGGSAGTEEVPVEKEDTAVVSLTLYKD